MVLNPAFINNTGITYTIIQNLNQYTTGNQFLTFFLIFLALLMMTFLLKIPLEFAMLLTLPMLIVVMAFVGEFKVVFIVVLVYVGIVMAKNFFFGRF
jgi:hypothetical protein